MSLKGKKILVFCGSKEGRLPVYRDEIVHLAAALKKHQASLIFGGSDMGLMHILCSEAARLGVPVTGVIPEGLHQRGIAFPGCTELLISKSLAERKSMMEERADAAICFPGGIGSLDEFLHALAGKQIGESRLPLVLLNLNGYYARLLELLQFFIQEGFAGEKIYHSFYTADSVTDAFTHLSNSFSGL